LPPRLIVFVGAKDNNMKINRDRHPKAKLPADENIPVWRYMDKWKFEDLIKKKKLYLRRESFRDVVSQIA
jgi:hypothetical protein